MIIKEYVTWEPRCWFSSVQVAIAAEDADGSIDLGTVEVVGETPLMVSGVPANKVPRPCNRPRRNSWINIRAFSGGLYALDFGSVSVNDAQNNPFQPDVQFRGFTASPLLGLPQGLSVYVTGIRFNEPFGDTVNWDLIPEGAVERMTLHSGSNAVYGLNTLGGAISLRTKTGFTAPGHTVEVAGGSWGRHWQEVTSGWNNGTVGYFVDLKSFYEDGWRDYSPTDVKGFARSAGKTTLQTQSNPASTIG